MKKYSCSYNGINPNFVLSDIEKHQDIDPVFFGMLDIVSNIIMRGVPTIPSQYHQRPYRDSRRKRRYVQEEVHFQNKVIMIIFIIRLIIYGRR